LQHFFLLVTGWSEEVARRERYYKEGSGGTRYSGSFILASLMKSALAFKNLTEDYIIFY
jgi:hypothetical protein